MEEEKHTGDTIQFFDTVEPIPMTVFYDEEKNIRRPTLQQLIFERPDGDQIPPEPEIDEDTPEAAPQVERNLFGTWDGVFARCLLNILGVIMFIRLGWIVGQAGIILTLVIVTLSSIITFVTSLSLSAICTNGEVKGGGAYYLISRSLGPEFGGAIGILFTVANAVAVALHIIGFAETLKTVLEEDHDFQMTSGGSWDICVYGLITLIILLIISLIGVEYVIKFGLVLLALLIISIVSIIVGSFVCCNSSDEDAGFVGYGHFTDNLFPDFRDGESFFSVLAVFFPAATGIMAGANISGDLKDAQKSIPLGTLLSIISSLWIYFILAIIVGSVSLREPEDDGDDTDFGLYKNFLIMNNISIWEPLVLVGIVAASLSSAISCLNGAPRILQAVAKDDLLPKLDYFAKGRGPNSEPDRASVLIVIISGAAIVVGDLNLIATYITNFFLISYAFVNYACFANSISQAPGWRPSFKYYNKWIALAGTLFCVAGMFLIDWVSAIVTVVVFVGLYKYLLVLEPDVNWGSSSKAQIFTNTLNNLLKLEKTTDHVKTFRPQLVTFIKDREKELNSVLFTSKLSGGTGLTTCATIYLPNQAIAASASPSLENVNQNNDNIRAIGYDNIGIQVKKIMDKRSTTVEFEDEKIFSSTVLANSFREGWRFTVQLIGIGKLRPNIAVFAFKESWNPTSDQNDTELNDSVNEFVDIIRDSFSYGLSVGIIRGMDTLSPDTKMKGLIDVYWLIEDGGLTILLPHILRQSSQWRDSQLRVYTKGREGDTGTSNTKEGALSRELLRMNRLMRKFRIPVSEIKLIQGLEESPSEQTVQEYQNLNVVDGIEHPRTRRYLRLSEKIAQESSQSDLVVISLPVPEAGLSSSIYMSWLHMMTKGVPRSLLLRGNNESVLTHLS